MLTLGLREVHNWSNYKSKVNGLFYV